YEPGKDHPLLIPTAADARPFWKAEMFTELVLQVKSGQVAVLQFHGVPDVAHPWVSSVADNFSAYMDWLHTNGYTVIAMRDLEKYVDLSELPEDPMLIMEQRKQAIAASDNK
ncbi:MAG: hypothetical protein ACI97B_002506, partial [Verrucomicrobiales bacterium]